MHNHISQGQPSQAIVLNTAQYKKAVYSALWVQVTDKIFFLNFLWYVVNLRLHLAGHEAFSFFSEIPQRSVE